MFANNGSIKKLQKSNCQWLGWVDQNQQACGFPWPPIYCSSGSKVAFMQLCSIKLDIQEPVRSQC